MASSVTSLPPIVVIASSVFFTLVLFVYLRALPKVIAGIPHNDKSARRVLGDLPELLHGGHDSSDVFRFVVAEALKFNVPVFQLFMAPFQMPWVIVTDYDAARDILIRRTPREFDSGDFFKQLLHGIMPHHYALLPSSQHFRDRRRIVEPAMSTTFLKEVAVPKMHDSAMALVELWCDKSKLACGEAFEAAEDLDIYMTDTMADTICGQDVGGLRSRRRALLQTSVTQAPGFTAKDISFPVSRESLVQATQVKDRLMAETLRDARGRCASGTSAVSTCVADTMVRQLSDQRPGTGYEAKAEEEMIRDDLFGLLTAGVGTTATTLCWSVKYLAAHQDAQAKLRAALIACLPSSSQSKDDLARSVLQSQVPYLDATIAEVLRVSTVAPAIVRTAVVDTEVLGHRIPKGTGVYMLPGGPGLLHAAVSKQVSQADMEREKDCDIAARRAWKEWTEATVGRFMPERWLARKKDGMVAFDQQAGPSLAFGYGLRGCFGRRMAEMQLRMTIAVLVLAFDFQPVEGPCSGFEADARLLRHPRDCFVRLRNLK